MQMLIALTISLLGLVFCAPKPGVRITNNRELFLSCSPSSCRYACCDTNDDCASDMSSCYRYSCMASMCEFNCCIDDRCGTQSECEEVKLYAGIIFGMVAGICVLTVCISVLCCMRRRHKRRVLIHNFPSSRIIRAMNNDDASGSERDFEEPVQEITVGQPVSYMPVMNGFIPSVIQGDPVTMRNGQYTIQGQKNPIPTQTVVLGLKDNIITTNMENHSQISQQDEALSTNYNNKYEKKKTNEAANLIPEKKNEKNGRDSDRDGNFFSPE